MSEKKYAIVRVNWRCPNKDNKEEIQDIFVCANRKDKREQNHNCSDCLYGDTKEQLVVKVAQILKQQMFILEVYEDYIEAAKNIVEFLGVIE